MLSLTLAIINVFHKIWDNNQYLLCMKKKFKNKVPDRKQTVCSGIAGKLYSDQRETPVIAVTRNWAEIMLLATFDKFCNGSFIDQKVCAIRPENPEYPAQ